MVINDAVPVVHVKDWDCTTLGECFINQTQTWTAKPHKPSLEPKTLWGTLNIILINPLYPFRSFQKWLTDESTVQTLMWNFFFKAFPEICVRLLTCHGGDGEIFHLWSTPRWRKRWPVIKWRSGWMWGDKGRIWWHMNYVWVAED